MKTKHPFHYLALVSAVTGLFVPAVVNGQDQPDRPGVELRLNGRKIEMKELKELAERAMNEMRLPEESRRLLRHHLAEGLEKAAPEARQPAFPDGPDSWRLGIACEPLDELLRAHLPLPKDVGLVVRAVMNDSPAAKAGLRVNDLLLAVGDHPLKSFPQLVEAVHNASETGHPLTLRFLHEGKEQTVVVKPEGPPPATRPEPGKPGEPGQAAPSEPARMIGEMHEMLGRQQRELGELRKRLEAQQQEIRKLHNMIQKDTN